MNNSHVNYLDTWPLSTKPSFYGYPNFELPLYFGAFCLSYSIGGLVLLYFISLNEASLQGKNNGFPYKAYALMLIFIQGPVSFIADFRKMNQISYFHPIDRFVAIPLMTMELFKIKKSIQNSSYSPSLIILYTSALLVALVSFYLSQQSQSNQDLKSFILWHNVWHSYPLAQILIMIYERNQYYQKQKKASNIVKITDTEQNLFFHKILLSDTSMRKLGLGKLKDL